MPTVEPSTTDTTALYAGEKLAVSALELAASGRVWPLDPPADGYTEVPKGGKIEINGPADGVAWYRIEAINGAIVYRRIGPNGEYVDHTQSVAQEAAEMATLAKPREIFVDMKALSQAIDKSSDTIAAATPIAKAIIEGKAAKMALKDKFAMLADRSKAIPVALAEKADKLHERMDALQARGNKAFAGLDAVLTDAEHGVAAAEDAVNQLTNGGSVIDP
jgi:hypothetical protein